MRALPLHKPVESFWFFDFVFFGLMCLSAVGSGFFFWKGGGWIWLGGFFLVSFLLAFYTTTIGRFFVRIRQYKEVLNEHPTRWVRVLCFSDLHSGSGWPQTEQWFRRLADRMRYLRPDLCLFAGDAVVAGSDTASVLSFFSDLPFEYGRYAVLGNHDYLDDPSAVIHAWRSAGWTVLSDSFLTISIQGSDLRLYGTSETVFGHPESSFFQDNSDSAPRLILAHHPDSVLDLPEQDRSLVFCGHTHGGQVRFPLFGALHIPSRLGRSADRGSRVIRGIRTIISQGLGVVGIRARWGAFPEVVVVDIGI